jgi:hypothetical protein
MFQELLENWNPGSTTGSKKRKDGEKMNSHPRRSSKSDDVCYTAVRKLFRDSENRQRGFGTGSMRPLNEVGTKSGEHVPPEFCT